MIEGTKIIIIGGSSGMGLEIARTVSQEGANVVIAGRSLQRLEAARNAIGRQNIETRALDIGDRKQVADVFSQLKQVDHVVVTAADLVYGPIAEINEQALMRAARSKLFGPIFVAQECTQYLSSQGTLTFISGIAAKRPMRGGSIPATLNSGLEGLTRALALERAPIRVNAISPGWVDTPVWDGMMAQEEKQQRFEAMKEKLPVKRIGKPQDIAAALLLILKNSFITGTVLDVDGGHRLV